MQELQQRIKRVVDSWGPNGNQPSEADYMEEMAKIRKAIVDFHGEMVLLVNYSNINYTGSLFLPFLTLKVQSNYKAIFDKSCLRNKNCVMVQ